MQTQTKDMKMLRRVVIASIVGCTIEWYDFFLYGVVAGIVLNKLYFPTADPLVSTLLAYATFAVGFLSRPLGGIIFGHFGDTLGRKKMLVLTLLIMGTSTVLIGCVPTYAQIGIWAPGILLLLRILQGIGLGGEWGGAVLMTFEYAKPSERGFYASLPQVGLSLGLCLASGVVGLLSNFLTNEQFMVWGWRLGFIVSIILLWVGSWIRLNVMETPEFQRVKEENKAAVVPFADMWRNFKGNVLAGMGARYIDGVFFNVFGVFSIAYLTQTLHIARTDALMGITIASLVMTVTIPFFGYLSDKVGRPKTYLVGSLVTGFSAFPAFWLMNNSNGSTSLVWLAIIVPLGIFYASVYGPEAALFADLFEARVRYTGISFVYQFSGIFASGLTPIIATSLLKLNDSDPFLVAMYVAFSGIVSAGAAWWIKSRQAGVEVSEELLVAEEA
jgi:metabolite-proton symporter